MLAGWLGSMKMGLWRFLGLNENYSVWEKMKWKQRGYWRDQDWSEWKSNGVRGRRLERVRLFADQHFLPHRPASFPAVAGDVGHHLYLQQLHSWQNAQIQINHQQHILGISAVATYLYTGCRLIVDTSSACLECYGLYPWHTLPGEKHDFLCLVTNSSWTPFSLRKSFGLLPEKEHWLRITFRFCCHKYFAPMCCRHIINDRSTEASNSKLCNTMGWGWSRLVKLFL